MNMAMEMGQDLGALFAEDYSDRGWHISFRLAPGIVANGIDPRAMLGKLAGLGLCRVIGRDENSPARAKYAAGERPIGWDMILFGNTTRAAIEDVFVDMPKAMELVIQQIH